MPFVQDSVAATACRRLQPTHNFNRRWQIHAGQIRERYPFELYAERRAQRSAMGLPWVFDAGLLCNGSSLQKLLVKWKFLLPMASAILTVLYPTEFTVYDVRVCEVLGDFSDLKYRTHFDRVWEGYSAYVARVRSEASHLSLLRDKERYLWGKSFAHDLRAGITN